MAEANEAEEVKDNSEVGVNSERVDTGEEEEHKVASADADTDKEKEVV